MKLLFSFDDGAKQDIGLAMMLKQYGFEKNTVFFIPSNCELPESSIKWLDDNGFMIGAHTVSHPTDMKVLNSEQLKSQIEDNAKWLEEITGKKPKWFCYPKGRYNEDTVQAVKAAGFEKARTVTVGNYKQPIDNFRIITSVHIYPNRKEYRGENWYSYAMDILAKASQEPDGVFHVFGHSWEIEKFGLWDEVEKLLKKLYEHTNRKDDGDRGDNSTY